MGENIQIFLSSTVLSELRFKCRRCTCRPIEALLNTLAYVNYPYNVWRCILAKSELSTSQCLLMALDCKTMQGIYSYFTLLKKICISFGLVDL
jgi:hypothetical protein